MTWFEANENRSVKKAVFPITGLGVRFLPVSKSIPREVMTLLDRPLIQYAIDEARNSGIQDFIFVNSGTNEKREEEYQVTPQVRSPQRKKSNTQLLAALRPQNMGLGNVAYIRQARNIGLGHAIWSARSLIGDEAFAVLCPNEIISADRPCMRQMLEVHYEFGGSVLAVSETALAAPPNFVLTSSTDNVGTVLQISELFESNVVTPGKATIAAIGRYIFDPQIIKNLNLMRQGEEQELPLVKAIAQEAVKGFVYGLRFRGQHYDCGSRAGFLKAALSQAFLNGDLREELRDWLIDHLGLNHMNFQGPIYVTERDRL